jgi:hypothetical protein
MPLTAKGQKIKSAMQEQYGKEKGEAVFYASKNKGNIKGVDRFRSTLSDAIARGIPVKDALSKAVGDATKPVYDAALKRRFRDSIRDAASRGMPAKDALARAFGARVR